VQAWIQNLISQDHIEQDKVQGHMTKIKTLDFKTQIKVKTKDQDQDQSPETKIGEEGDKWLRFCYRKSRVSTQLTGVQFHGAIFCRTRENCMLNA